MRGETPFLFAAIRLLPVERVHYRWCRRCRWKGVALVTPLPPRRPLDAPPPERRPGVPADAVRVQDRPRPPTSA
jgi:hypothetical protein